MADNMLGSDWETSLFRRALEQIGDEESLREFDEEQEKLKREAEEETRQMIKDGLLMV